MFLFVLTQAIKFQYNDALGLLIHKKDKRAFDGSPFVVGIITILKQFHASITQQFLAYLGQYVRSFINFIPNRDSKSLDYPEEVLCVLLFLEDFVKYSNFDRKVVESKFFSFKIFLTIFFFQFRLSSILHF